MAPDFADPQGSSRTSPTICASLTTAARSTPEVRKRGRDCNTKSARAVAETCAPPAKRQRSPGKRLISWTAQKCYYGPCKKASTGYRKYVIRVDLSNRHALGAATHDNIHTSSLNPVEAPIAASPSTACGTGKGPIVKPWEGVRECRMSARSRTSPMALRPRAPRQSASRLNPRKRARGLAPSP